MLAYTTQARLEDRQRADPPTAVERAQWLALEADAVRCMLAGDLAW